MPTPGGFRDAERPVTLPENSKWRSKWLDHKIVSGIIKIARDFIRMEMLFAFTCRRRG
jgi:hypothetical protein